MAEINYRDLLKEQAAVILLPVVLCAALIGAGGYIGYKAFSSIGTYQGKSQEIQTLTTKKEGLENQLKELAGEETSHEIKKIYELEGMQFGMDASFAPQFDNMIKVAKESGIRIRSVDYNYAPANDPIYKAQISGYNVCELTTTIVGKYSEIQTFLKTMIAEDYLINLAELEIVSWQRDKSILIANMKLRFYTRTE